MERNKVLDLYVRKNRESIEKKYHEIVEKEYNELPEVKEYNDLINTFATSLEELTHRYNNDFELNTIMFTQTGYLNQFAWEINPSLKNDIKQKHQKEFEDEMYALDNLANEVQAILSISEDKDYQIEVLKNYDILDKKGKLNI